MNSARILLSNVAYGRDIGGTLGQQVLRSYRHLVRMPGVGRRVADSLRRLVEAGAPDVCGLVEVDRGLGLDGGLGPMHESLRERYPHSDVANKYFRGPFGGRLPFLGRNCNAVFSRLDLPIERVYLREGMKRLVHRVALAPGLTLSFVHLALRREARRRQIESLREMLVATPGEHVVMGDFNVFSGVDEVSPLTAGAGLALLNDPALPTHRFHRRERILDLCLVSESLRERSRLDVLPQPFSDHAALLLHLDDVRLEGRNGSRPAAASAKADAKA